mgnify:FL=1
MFQNLHIKSLANIRLSSQHPEFLGQDSACEAKFHLIMLTYLLQNIILGFSSVNNFNKTQSLLFLNAFIWGFVLNLDFH